MNRARMMDEKVDELPLKPRLGDDGSVCFVIPARNEAASIGGVVQRLRTLYPDSQICVVDDGSDDGTAQISRGAGALVVTRPVGMGNGAAIKAGARATDADILVMLDADGQHSAEDVDRLLEQIRQGFDMAVGARVEGQSGRHRAAANAFYNRFASWIVGHRIPDLTSGFRAVRARHFRKFLHLLPNGFSYPTTITMCFFRAGYTVAYVPIKAASRQGRRSHIRLLHDGIRFLLIIFRIGTLYSPLKIFFPASVGFLLTGIGHYAYNYITMQRFTNMSALLLITSILVFLIGLISEQITALTYKDTEH